MKVNLDKLAAQSLIYVDTGLDDGKELIFSKEKFAELIVRECAGVCDDERDSTDSEFGKLVAEGCALKIMERFGVEE